MLAMFFGMSYQVDKAREARESRTPAEIAAEQAKEQSEKLRLISASAAIDALKSSMRDPDSLVIDSLRISNDAKTICIEYRSRNGFGGMNRAMLVYIDGKPKQTPEQWNKNCLGPMRDLTPKK